LDGLVIVLIIGAVLAVVDWLNKAAKKQKEEQAARRRAAQRRQPAAAAAQDEDEEDRWQAPQNELDSFLKRVAAAEGGRQQAAAPAPPQAAPPPPMAPPRPATGDLEVFRPPRREGPAAAIPMAEAVETLRRRSKPQKPKRQSRRKAAPPAPSKAAAMVVGELREPAKVRIPILGVDPIDARQAIVLAEILGPPRSRQPMSARRGRPR